MTKDEEFKELVKKVDGFCKTVGWDAREPVVFLYVIGLMEEEGIDEA